MGSDPKRGTDVRLPFLRLRFVLCRCSFESRSPAQGTIPDVEHHLLGVIPDDEYHLQGVILDVEHHLQGVTHDDKYHLPGHNAVCFVES
jgi:hypothetical protein